MSDDLLHEATRALKESADAPADAASFTRARVLRDVHRSERRRVSRTLVLVPAAAILLAATAALATSGGLSGAWNKVVSVVTGERLSDDGAEGTELERGARGRQRAAAPAATEPSAPAPSAVAAAPESEPAQEPSGTSDKEPAQDGRSGADAPVANEPNPSTRSETAVGKGSKGSGTAAASTAATTAQAAADAAAGEAEERELELYRTAHRAHFTDRDFASALAAWDRYLQELPRGKFATEATYNRALCLVRLGRNSEAEQALGPFAEGRFGGYRREEAARLIEMLRGGAPAAGAKPDKP